MRIVDRFPHEVVEDRLCIPMSDGTDLWAAFGHGCV